MSEIPEEYNTLADRTAQEMVSDYLFSCYKIIKTAQPDICGFKASLYDDEEECIVNLDIMKRQP